MSKRILVLLKQIDNAMIPGSIKTAGNVIKVNILLDKTKQQRNERTTNN
jgi:hypothetical protein